MSVDETLMCSFKFWNLLRRRLRALCKKFSQKNKKNYPPRFCSELSEDFKTISGLSVRRLISSQWFFKVVRGSTKILYCWARRERLSALLLSINNKMMTFLLKNSFMRVFGPIWDMRKIFEEKKETIFGELLICMVTVKNLFKGIFKVRSFKGLKNF